MLSIGFLLFLDYVMVLITQVVASIQDLRTREISDWTWIIGSIICVPLGVYLAAALGESLIYVISLVFGVVVGLLSYWLRAMGGADSKSIMFISASIPPITMPSPALSMINTTSLSVLVNALIIAIVIYIPYNVIQNVRYGGRCEALRRARGLNKALCMVTLMCVPAHRVLRNPNNYSVSQVLADGDFEPVIKLGLDVEDPREQVLAWISEGRIDVDTPVLVSYHIPMIIPITFGLITYLLTHLNFLTVILATWA